jgi:hypothetical protein
MHGFTHLSAEPAGIAFGDFPEFAIGLLLNSDIQTDDKHFA